jgi:hypothetical protein
LNSCRTRPKSTVRIGNRCRYVYKCLCTISPAHRPSIVLWLTADFSPKSPARMFCNILASIQWKLRHVKGFSGHRLRHLNLLSNSLTRHLILPWKRHGNAIAAGSVSAGMLYIYCTVRFDRWPASNCCSSCRATAMGWRLGGKGNEAQLLLKVCILNASG